MQTLFSSLVYDAFNQHGRHKNLDFTHMQMGVTTDLNSEALDSWPGCCMWCLGSENKLKLTEKIKCYYNCIQSKETLFIQLIS